LTRKHYERKLSFDEIFAVLKELEDEINR